MGGDFPANWKLMPLGDCMAAIIDYRGKTPRKTSSGIPLITAKIIKNGRIEAPGEFIDPNEYEDWMRRGIPETGDVLITTEAPLGEVAQLKDARVALAQRLIALRGQPGLLDNNFLKFLMQSKFVQEQLKARSTGTTVLGIKQSELRRVLLAFPEELIEQQAIACILGSLDDKIELNRQMNQTLEAIARAIFQSWFVDFDPVRAKAAGQPPPGLAPHIAELFPDSFVDSELGEIPRGWNIQSFDQLVEIFSGGTPKTTIDAYWNGDIPWFTVKDAPLDSNIFVIDTERYITQAAVDNSATKILPFGTTIISARGTVGKLAMVGRPMAMNQTCYGLKGKCGYNDFFIYFQIKKLIDELKQRTHGCVFDTIIRDTFKMLAIPVPPVDLAETYGIKVESMLKKILNNLKELEILSGIRDTLLPKLISGVLRFPDAERIVGRCT